MYVRPKTIIRLNFGATTKWPGLEVNLKPLDLGAILDMSVLKDIEGVKATDLTPEQRSELVNVFGLFAESLVSWTLAEENDTPGGPPIAVPPTLAGVRSQDSNFMVELMLLWLDKAVNVPEELGKDSTSGPRFPEHHIPMVPQSLSLPSFATPA